MLSDEERKAKRAARKATMKNFWKRFYEGIAKKKADPNDPFRKRVEARRQRVRDFTRREGR